MPYVPRSRKARRIGMSDMSSLKRSFRWFRCFYGVSIWSVKEPARFTSNDTGWEAGLGWKKIKFQVISSLEFHSKMFMQAPRTNLLHDIRRIIKAPKWSESVYCPDIPPCVFWLGAFEFCERPEFGVWLSQRVSTLNFGFRIGGFVGAWELGSIAWLPGLYR